MKITVTFDMFRQAFIDCRYVDNFSYDGLQGLFDFLEEVEYGTGHESELDVIGLCCEYLERSLEDIQNDYGNLKGENWETLEEAVEWLEDRTCVVWHDESSVIFECF